MTTQEPCSRPGSEGRAGRESRWETEEFSSQAWPAPAALSGGDPGRLLSGCGALGKPQLGPGLPPEPQDMKPALRLSAGSRRPPKLG